MGNNFIPKEPGPCTAVIWHGAIFSGRQRSKRSWRPEVSRWFRDAAADNTGHRLPIDTLVVED